MGCLQESVISPCVWNIYIDPILNLNSEKCLVQAFADGLALVSTGRTRRELETNTNEILEKIMESLTSLRLKLSVDKCQAIAIRSKQNLNHQRTGQVVFNRSPCFKINNKGIKYFVVVEKALLYGAGVWGGSLNNENIKRLTTIQRAFLLKFTKVYRTTSTQVLGVLAGIPPTLPFCQSRISKISGLGLPVLLGRALDVGELDHFVKLSSVSIEFRINDIKPQIENSQFEVYMDGSRIGDDCGFSVCILKNEHPFKIFKFKLSKNNTVFQAELAAINFAVRWAQENGLKIKIYTDSQPSIEVEYQAQVCICNRGKKEFLFGW
ncbi:hypothetical protein AVEN_152265-1 [Araneus ventricosus]|uniref:Reverse transcriptase domain-containing protein n=1 Tax=Araneus ventricosus TaxID=182803 RepID=A0A4Y2H842_ARAVE|nr:hypothetical protein AVEN_152265-1 [Araneus ventricosus]